MFLDDLQSLFDISTKDAIETMKNEQEKAFLAMQREDTSSCSMSSVDKISPEREIIKQKRLHKEEQRKRKYAKEQMQENKTPMLSDATETSEGSDSDNEENNVPVPSLAARKKQKKNPHEVITPNVASTLDRVNISDRGAMMVATSIVKALGHNVKDVSLSRSGIRRACMVNRINAAAEQLKKDQP